MEKEIKIQDNIDQAETTPSIEVNNQLCTDRSDNPETVPMEIQINNQDLDIKAEDKATISALDVNNIYCSDLADNTLASPIIENQINNQGTNIVQRDDNAETGQKGVITSPEMEIINQEIGTGSIDAQTKLVLENQDVRTDRADTTALMEIQSNNQDLNTENAIDNTGTPVYIENEYQYPNVFTNKTLLPLYCASWSKSFSSKEDDQNYLRGCKWSPDGTCLLSVVNNDGVHMSELPRDLVSGSKETEILKSTIHLKESGLVYDFCWYPFMNSEIPASCCWITTKQRAPIQLWDAFDGSLRASYRGYNAVDEMEPAISITFSIDGTRIIAGYKKVLRTFDIERPGRDFAEHKITSPASCFAVSGDLLTMGSWNTSISLFSVSQSGTYKSIGKMHGHSGGVTHMKFTPDGLKLVSGARKDHRLLIWDIRYYRRPLNILSRAVDTNQRIYFDISPCGRYLVTGGTDGNLKVWDVEHVNWRDRLNTADIEADSPTRTFPLHKDCCNSVSIHPYLPLLATGSGQYHLHDLTILDDDKANENIILDKSSEVVINERKTQEAFDTIDMKYSSRVENKLVVWWTAETVDSISI